LPTKNKKTSPHQPKDGWGEVLCYYRAEVSASTNHDSHTGIVTVYASSQKLKIPIYDSALYHMRAEKCQTDCGKQSAIIPEV
jgi:hypothetical protein